MPCIQREFYLTAGFDGPWFPGPLGGLDARAGAWSGGVGALLSVLGLHLGVVPEEMSRAERLVTTVQIIRETVARGEGGPVASSFDLDPEGVAWLLLNWRDDLLLHGWSGDAAALPDRLRNVLNVLSGGTAGDIAFGLPDSILRLLDVPALRTTRVVDRVRLAEPREHYPPLVGRLLTCMAEAGTVISWEEIEAVDSEGRDLVAARDAARGVGSVPPVGDGSLLRLTPGSPWEGAEVVAAWLASLPDVSNVVVIAEEGLRAELDGALARHGVPSVGSGAVSPYRAALQVLPLFLGLQWAPLNPSRFLEYLQLPVHPLPRSARTSLAILFSEYPGMGGQVWNAKIEDVIVHARKNARDTRADEAEAELRILLRDWLPAPDALAGEFLLTARVLELVGRVADWARKRAHAMEASDLAEEREGAEILGAAACQADLLADLLRQSGINEWSQLALQRLQLLALGEGAAMSYRAAEKGAVRVVSSPGAVLGPVDTVLWWNFTRNGAETPRGWSFTRAERRALREQGIKVPEPAEEAARLAERWARPLRFARSRLVAVSHRLDGGEEVPVHPLWDAVTAGWKPEDHRRVTVPVSALLEGASTGLNPETIRMDPLPAPGAKRLWNLPEIKKAVREKESYSSLSSFVSCPFQYVLRYGARLRPATAVSLVEDHLLKGNLGHLLAQDLLTSGGAIPDTKKLRDMAERHVDELLNEMGTSLAMTGKEADLSVYRASIVEAVVALGGFLRKNGLKVVGAEEKLLTDLPDGTILFGFVDLLVEDRRGNRMVLDMKYSDRGVGSYASKLADGKALQLAVYARILGPGTAAAYVSLRDGRVVTPEPNPVPGGRRILGPSLDDLWNLLETTVTGLRGEHKKTGEVLAAGVPDADGKTGMPEIPGGLAKVDPPCEYCDYGAVCGWFWPEGEGA